ncbi:MAG: tRNA pseudouridine(38-40) synthase TruA [Pigmentiphaga sp.]|nr:tRNA pseudouridine(38-40) synthase TruA [Pigmentiphaga sp.]
MPRMTLGLAYDGRPWRGWQTQPGGQTVQDTLEAALRAFIGQAVPTICAGRTDTGVHAALQVVHLDSPVDRAERAWVRGLNANLPASVAVRWARPVPESFHARFSATGRHYVYRLLVDPVRSPLWAGRAGWCFRPLEVEAMREAAAAVVGTHDFTSFRSSQCQAASPVRTVHSLDIREHGRFLLFSLHANAFLHHMVRNLVGSLVYVGLGRQPVAWMAELLAARNRSLGAPTYAPDGLYLTGVDYPGFDLPESDNSREILDSV